MVEKPKKLLIFQYFPGPFTKFQYIQGLEFLLSNSSIFKVFQDVYEPCVRRPCVVVRGHARSCAAAVRGRARSCVVVRGSRAWSCAVHRAWSCVVVRGRARSCTVVRGRAWSYVVVRGRAWSSLTAVLPASRPALPCCPLRGQRCRDARKDGHTRDGQHIIPP